jgi:hypothetical protein
VLGAVGAWLGGFTRGRTPASSAARVFAITRLCMELLGAEHLTSALREPLPVLTLALTRNFGCMVGISRRPQAR